MSKEDSAPQEWQVLPFYRSLSEQVLMFGVPKPLLVINALLAYMFIVNFHFWYILVLNAIIHFGSIYIASQDDQFFDCLKSYQSKKSYYCT